MVRFSPIFVLLLGALVVLACSPAANAVDVHAIAQGVDARYNRLKSLQADFSETYRGAGAERTESGTLWLKKPGKMRWEYRSPKEKLFLSDGKDAWFYVPGDRQVRRTAVKKLDDLRSPLAFLLGKAKLEKELQGLSLAPDVAISNPQNIALRGVPEGLGGRITQILLEITPSSQIVRMVVEEADGGSTDYRFTSQQENVEVNDQQFRFIPPRGVEVIDEQFGQ